MSSNCYNAIVGNYKSITNISQDIVEANLEGKIADMSAGELRFAAGISNRQNGFTYQPGNPQASIYDAPLGLFVSNPTAGETEVSEIYGELLVPVTERFEVDLAARYSDFDSAASSAGPPTTSCACAPRSRARIARRTRPSCSRPRRRSSRPPSRRQTRAA
jgi:hypothetical protein